MRSWRNEAARYCSILAPLLLVRNSDVIFHSSRTLCATRFKRHWKTMTPHNMLSHIPRHAYCTGGNGSEVGRSGDTLNSSCESTYTRSAGRYTRAPLWFISKAPAHMQKLEKQFEACADSAVGRTLKSNRSERQHEGNIAVYALQRDVYTEKSTSMTRRNV
jgi:hypothetical protein